MVLDLFVLENLLSEKTLDNGLESLVFLFDAQLSCLFVDFWVGSGSVVLKPLLKVGVRSGFFLFVLSSDESRLKATAEGFHAGSLSFLGGIGGPVDLVCIHSLDFGHVCGTGLDLAGHLICTIVFFLALGRFSRAILLGALLLARFLGRVLEDKGDKLVAHINWFSNTTSFAVAHNYIVLGNDQVRLGVLAGRAEDKFRNEPVEKFAKSSGSVRAVDNVTASIFVPAGLSTKLTTEELGGI